MEKLESICHNYRLNALYVFGSRSKEIADFINGKGNIDKDCNADVDQGCFTCQGFPVESPGQD